MRGESKETLPLPSVSAGRGPFVVQDAEGKPPYCRYPTDGNPGVFVTPLGNGKEDVAARMHGYGVLLLYKLGIVSPGLGKRADAHGIHESWLHAALCVAATSFLLARRCNIVRSHRIPADNAEELSKAAKAQL